jgi:hypothetical protein
MRCERFCETMLSAPWTAPRRVMAIHMRLIADKAQHGGGEGRGERGFHFGEDDFAVWRSAWALSSSIMFGFALNNFLTTFARAGRPYPMSVIVILSPPFLQTTRVLASRLGLHVGGNVISEISDIGMVCFLKR